MGSSLCAVVVVAVAAAVVAVVVCHRSQQALLRAGTHMPLRCERYRKHAQARMLNTQARFVLFLLF